MTIGRVTFADPAWLLLLVPLSMALIFSLVRLRQRAVWSRSRDAIQVGSAAPWIAAWNAAVAARPSLKYGARLSRLAPLLLRAGALALVVIALARPQSGPRGKSRSVDGLDIQLVLDTSGSMRAQDFQLAGQRPTRLEVVKSVIENFIGARTDDRIGLVVFGTEAFTQAPLTLDHDLLRQFLKHINISMAGDATAIGDGLATAVKRLQTSDGAQEKIAGKFTGLGTGKVVILLTDGANNAGRIDPVTAAEAAKALGVKVYTIGVGSRGKVPMEVNGRTVQVDVDIDEGLLEKIATMTGGKFYRATDTQALIAVYADIDKLEKTKGKAPVRDIRRELYASFLWPALILLMVDVLFAASRRKVVPA